MHPLVYGYSLALSKERDIHIAVSEHEVLGADHAEIGASLASHWNLPATIRIPIRHHHFIEFDEQMPKEVHNHNLIFETGVLSISNLMTAAFDLILWSCPLWTVWMHSAKSAATPSCEPHQ